MSSSSDPHPVTAVDRLDGVGRPSALRSRLTQPCTTLAAEAGGCLTPQRLGEGLGVHPLARTQGEGGDDDAVAGPEHLGRAVDLERSEHP